MSKPNQYNDLLRQINELKRQLNLIEAESKTCADEGNDIVARNATRLAQLKSTTADLKIELTSMARMSEAQGILSLLAQNQIDISQYKKKKTSEILLSLDWRIADIVKNTDIARHQTNRIYQRISELEQLHRDAKICNANRLQAPQDSQQLRSFISAKDGDREAILTDIQSVKQKIAEAGHVQRQYRTMMDVVNNERIGYEKQLLDLEKEIADAKAEAERLKDMKETARQARDAAKAELLHHEENLVTSTRETDRLLNEYKRRIEELKMNLGEGSSAGKRTMNAVVSTTVSRSRPASPFWTSETGASAEEALHADRDMLTLQETKTTIERLKSVTGATDVRSVIYIICSQKEKCDELRRQCHVLQEKLNQLIQQRDDIRSRLPANYQMSLPASSTPSISFQESIRDPTTEAAVTDESQLQLQRIESNESQPTVHLDEASINELASFIMKICDKIPFGRNVDGDLHIMDVLSILENKLMALTDHMKNIKAEHPNQDTYYQGGMGLPLQRGPDSPSRSPLPMEDLDLERTRRILDANSIDEDQVPTRGFLKRQSLLIVESRTKKSNQRPRKLLE